ncbi:LysR family transcriptional regulator [Sorangium sp. So ce590]|uniref:helix-turn-helix domain-containing protein n=1 Tax=Sorangium sp. So ce590 TaxID=3133317 RepID=UPI003F617A69
MGVPGLDGVEQFLLVAELGSFSAAARRLAVSPSAVSLAVRHLEQRLGTAAEPPRGGRQLGVTLCQPRAGPAVGA